LNTNDVLSHPLELGGLCPCAFDSLNAGFHAEANQQIIPCQGAGQKNITAACKKEQPASVLTWSDVYRGNSINNPEKEKRDSESGHKFRIFKADHRTHQ